MSSLFGYLAVGNDSTVYALASTDGKQYFAYEYEPQAKMWLLRNEFAPNSRHSFRNVSVGNQKNIWASTVDPVNNTPQLFRRNPEEDAWIQVQRPVDDLHTAWPHVGTDGTVWLQSMKLDGPEDKTLWKYTGQDTLWERMPGGQEIYDIAVGGENLIYAVRNDGSGKIYKFDSDQWVAQNSPAVCPMYQKLYLSSISVGNDGTIAVVGSCHNSFVDCKNVAWRSFDSGKTWKMFPLPESRQLLQVSVGGKDCIWMCQSGSIYRWAENENKWELIPTSTIPLKDAISKIQTNLAGMIDLVDTYHNYFQSNVSELYTLCQVKDDDSGQQIANKIMLKSFDAIGMIEELPGAGAIAGVLSATFNYMITDGGYDWNKTFANIWSRLTDNSLDLRGQLSTIHDNVVDNWNVKFVNPNSGTIVTVADLVESVMPDNHSANFQKMLHQMLIDGRYQLWKDVLPRRWDKVHLGNPIPMHFQTEQEAKDYIKGYIDKNANYYIIPYQTQSFGRKYWDVREWWLGYGAVFPYNHHEAPPQLCLRLFKDDGLGNIVRPNSITTRADVFEKWGLKELTVILSPASESIVQPPHNTTRLREAALAEQPVTLRQEYRFN